MRKFYSLILLFLTLPQLLIAGKNTIVNQSKDTIWVTGVGFGCLKAPRFGYAAQCDSKTITPGQSGTLNMPILGKGNITVEIDASEAKYKLRNWKKDTTFYFPKDFDLKKAAKAKITNTTNKPINVIVSATGCMGIDKGIATSCGQNTIDAGQSAYVPFGEKMAAASGRIYVFEQNGSRYEYGKAGIKGIYELRGQELLFPKDFRIAMGGYANIILKNNAKNVVTFVSRKTGCAGTSEGMTLTCKTEQVDPGKDKVMVIKYPYYEGFEIIAFDKETQTKSISTKKFNDQETVNYPEDFVVVNKFVLPDPSLRYDQVCYLCSHNSYSSLASGYIYYQQAWSIKQQLDKGIRMFMLDTYVDKNCEVKMCHQSCSLTKGLKPGTSPKSLKSALEVVKAFLDKNPNEVITINLEDYMYKANKEESCKAILNEDPYMTLENNVIESLGEDFIKMILTKADWEPNNDANNGKWPTLQWLLNKNKRVIFFTSDSSEASKKYMYNIWDYTIETQYSSTDPAKICAKQRQPQKTSFPRRLYLINIFPSVSWMGTVAPVSFIGKLVAGGYNSYNKIWKVIKACEKISEGQLPNQIAIDLFEKNTQDLLRVSNQINKMQEQEMQNLKKKNSSPRTTMPGGAYPEAWGPEGKKEVPVR